MGRRSQNLFHDLRRSIGEHGVLVILKQMDIETPGVFDGQTIVINPEHEQLAASYYLAHSFGSIVQWSTTGDLAKRVFDDLRDGKKERDREPARFERAIERYHEFEQTSSEHAVWMLAETGHGGAVPDYTTFFRADIEAMTIFHRTGKAPRWPEFYTRWQQLVATGEIRIEPFVPRPFARFRPVRIEHQEVVQERD